MSEVVKLNIFIGYDSKEVTAYHVLASSIIRRASIPVTITPLSLHSLGHVFTRQRGTTEATEFSISRFLVPYLSDYKGWSLFMDCDMLCKIDVGVDILLHQILNEDKAVVCCQHDYVPKSTTKFLGQTQTSYPKKNWSSMMLMNNAKCTALTPDYVNTATGLDLHRFNWLKSDDEIGALPLEYNWLVGEYDANPNAKILHYTLGGPWFPDYRESDHAADWFAEYEQMI
jgi:hypothetical protein